ncbi:MAG: PilZ domain-containing protein [Deltaproteobacteria bacterium]|nr:PilZ domain-containing protein [Deltaproteobacteria bacterium]
MREEKGHERRASTRKEMETKIEFFVNADIIAAKSIDISKTGLRFDTGEPLKIHLRMNIDGKLCDREAQFIWATRNSKGSMTYGFEFIPDPKESLF